MRILLKINCQVQLTHEENQWGKRIAEHICKKKRKEVVQRVKTNKVIMEPFALTDNSRNLKAVRKTFTTILHVFVN